MGTRILDVDRMKGNEITAKMYNQLIRKIDEMDNYQFLELYMQLVGEEE